MERLTLIFVAPKSMRNALATNRRQFGAGTGSAGRKWKGGGAGCN